MTKINEDIKQAMLSGDKRKVGVLKGLKSAIQYAGITGNTAIDLTDQDVTLVLKKEQKKRVDAAELYKKANDIERSEQELYERDIIGEYLPDSLSEAELSKLIDTVITELGDASQKNMGQIISNVKQLTAGAADGSVIAKLVKQRFT